MTHTHIILIQVIIIAYLIGDNARLTYKKAYYKELLRRHKK